ncbi:hypothetical protein K435DRAFT_852531 [Dendrothele bispora CBS 962.96]|uniref:C2H2-type domain-containing protein n=1 Tax=Dendrothele bispora (strain CBS 962.96) TaxID=1314807 RepID=A0A4S8MIW7_DENBC|nr:hypothetical protein K435DRAFT_852531 [Dendrothele bispora CBS 962.96]
MAFECPSCGKPFSNGSSLQKHRSTSQKCSKVKPKLKPVAARRKDKIPRASGSVDPVTEGEPSLGMNIEEHLDMVIDEPSPSATTELPPAPPPPTKPPTNALRPSRTGLLYNFLKDHHPPTLPSTEVPDQVPYPVPESTPESVGLPEFVYVDTDPDEFGIYRSYPTLPKSIPDEEIPLVDICEGSGFPCPPPLEPLSIFGSFAKKIQNAFAPFLNPSIFRLMAWFYNGHESKSFADLDNLVDNVIMADDFKKEDLKGFRAKKVARDMDEYLGPRFSFEC